MNNESEPPKKHKHKSVAHSNRNKLFHQTQTEAPGVKQTTTVTVNLHDEAPDCITSCFKGLAAIFKKGA